MPAVFVHGVPETSRIWDAARSCLASDSVALALPGFGNPRPPGFTATKDAYAEWLADALMQIAEPVDLVGHDWGALLTMRVVTAYDVPLRSWVVDVANVFHPDFVWHEAARIWQTPEAGEQWMQAAREAPPPEPAQYGDPPHALGRASRGGRSYQW
jgi:pimeloyl-ACP methyl ester carboxylesterase